MQTNDVPKLRGLSYLFSQEGNKVVAHCLNLDLVSSGDSIAEAEERLNVTVVAQIFTAFKNGNWSQLTVDAPPEFWDAIHGATALQSGLLEVEIPPVILPIDRHFVPVARFQRAALAVA